MHITRKSFLIDIWTNHSFYSKKHVFYRNTEEGPLAYSLLQEPCIVIHRFVSPLEPKVLSTFRRIESGARLERFSALWTALLMIYCHSNLGNSFLNTRLIALASGRGAETPAEFLKFGPDNFQMHVNGVSSTIWLRPQSTTRRGQIAPR